MPWFCHVWDVRKSIHKLMGHKASPLKIPSAWFTSLTDKLEPRSEHLRSEPAIVPLGIANATLGSHPIDWNWVIQDYGHIRDLIADTIPGFTGFNQKLENPGGFHWVNPAANRQWNTLSGKAQFGSNELPKQLINEAVLQGDNKPDLILQTIVPMTNTLRYMVWMIVTAVSHARSLFINEADQILSSVLNRVTGLIWCRFGKMA